MVVRLRHGAHFMCTTPCVALKVQSFQVLCYFWPQQKVPHQISIEWKSFKSGECILILVGKFMFQAFHVRFCVENLAANSIIDRMAAGIFVGAGNFISI